MNRFAIACTLVALLALVTCQKTSPTQPATAVPPNAEVLGQPLTGAMPVKLEDLLIKANEFSGKTVAIEGRVVAMCYHAKDWFALAPSETSQQNVRVLTSSDFRVPDNAMGKTARAEGVVELVQIEEQAAKHYAKDHKLGDPNAINGSVQQVVLRAKNAVFY